MTIRETGRGEGLDIVVAGSGGNIGSHLLPHLPRMPGVSRVTLIDPGTYEPKNVRGQDIEARDAGRPKTIVQAERLRRIRDDLLVAAVVAPIESVPLGALRADVLLSCVDSRRARQSINRVTRRLGIPWIDAGVAASQRLARVSVYPGGEASACQECAWDERDYETLEPVYSCLGEEIEPPETGAPSSLGALAAALQAIECQELLAGAPGTPIHAREIVLSAAHHRVLVSMLRRNAACRFEGHDPWRIERLAPTPAEITLGESLALGSDGADIAGRAIRVEGSPFTTRLVCVSCGWSRSLLKLEVSLGSRERRCRRCGGALIAPGFDKRERIGACGLPRRTLDRPLAGLGFRPGEVFSISGANGEQHYELAAEPE